jgi:hypothetical protein
MAVCSLLRQGFHLHGYGGQAGSQGSSGQWDSGNNRFVTVFLVNGHNICEYLKM